jgi:hypothetical protein
MRRYSASAVFVYQLRKELTTLGPRASRACAAESSTVDWFGVWEDEAKLPDTSKISSAAAIALPIADSLALPLAACLLLELCTQPLDLDRDPS